MKASATAPRRILVTGAAGFVGGYAIAALKNAYPDATIIQGGVGGEGRSDFETFNIADIDQTRAAIERIKPDGVLHLAAIADPAKARLDARATWDVNFSGVMNVVEAAMAQNPNTIFVFAGSSESYGAAFRDCNGPISEEAALKPLNIYGATKAAADIYLGQLASAGSRIIRFRPFNHTGAGQSPVFVAPAFAWQIAEIEAGRQPPTIKVGNLDVERDLLDVRDVARAYALAFAYAPGEGDPSVFNLAVGAPLRIGALLDKLRSMSDRTIAVEVDPQKLRSNEIASISGDARRAEKYLGWRAEIPIEATLANVLSACRESVRT
ncbi:MAG: GDP-mannose 4,6-dehydratase [Parvularculaceae bacterium]|nr:GDP-mannose 4,6-dehydratase [Parvularculaceae bacterium]